MPNSSHHEYKLMKVKFFGGIHKIQDELTLFLDPAAIHFEGQGIVWEKLSAWQIRKIRKHMCPVYKSNTKSVCHCQLTWEWKHGY